jgi:lysyl-tRNA synthetase class 2
MLPLKPGTPDVPHKAILRGRVVDVTSVAGEVRLALMVEEHTVFLTAPPDTDARPGDLVEVRTSASGEVTTLRRLGGALPGAWRETGDALRWRRPGQAPSRIAHLRLRAEVHRALRAYLDGQGFIEVDTPAWVRAPSPEPHFTPLQAGDGWLITSPEFQLKRLLVGGLERIYRLGPVFRGGERGAHHSPEFTMLEWYRAWADSATLADDLAAMLRAVAPLAEAFAAAHGEPAAPRLRLEWTKGPLPQLTVAALFRHHLGLELQGITQGAALRQAAMAAAVPGAERLADDFELAFFTLWVEVERRFGAEPFLVTDWPAPLASLARLKCGDATVAERMELYGGGLELANGFAELTDPAEQRRRFEANLAQRAVRGLPPVPLDDTFLAALAEGMPPSAGMALGVDRLVMFATGCPDIRQVLPFAEEELGMDEIR